MKIGILGAGQLSRMLALAGIPMGIEFIFYTPATEHCVKHLGELTIAPYEDLDKLQAFADLCDVITFENENIPYQSLALLEKSHPIYPNAAALRVSQDRLFEKKLFDELGIPTVPYQVIDNPNDLSRFVSSYSFPIIKKERTQGYDGKGQFWINNSNDLALCDFKNAIVEQVIPFKREISIIGIRAIDGQTKFYDLCENKHINGILHSTINRPNDPMCEHAIDYLNRLLKTLDYVGCLTLELFETESGLLANEMAPRVHNSGHWTIEGTRCSQFANHLRAIAGLTLGDTRSTGIIRMQNLLGQVPPYKSALTDGNRYLHDYQKKPLPGRKVGHLCEIID